VHTDGWTGYDDLEALGYVHKPGIMAQTHQAMKSIT
jgi:hypothetical protein